MLTINGGFKTFIYARETRLFKFSSNMQMTVLKFTPLDIMTLGGTSLLFVVAVAAEPWAWFVLERRQVCL